MKSVIMKISIYILAIIGCVACRGGDQVQDHKYSIITRYSTAYKPRGIILIQRAQDVGLPLQSHVIGNLEHPSVINELASNSSAQERQAIHEVRSGIKRSYIFDGKEEHDKVYIVRVDNINSNELGVVGITNDALRSLITQSFDHQGLVGFTKSHDVIYDIAMMMPFLRIASHSQHDVSSCKLPSIVLTQSDLLKTLLTELRVRIPHIYTSLMKEVDQQAPESFGRGMYQLVIAGPQKKLLRKRMRSALRTIDDAQALIKKGKEVHFNAAEQDFDASGDPRLS